VSTVRDLIADDAAMPFAEVDHVISVLAQDGCGAPGLKASKKPAAKASNSGSGVSTVSVSMIPSHCGSPSSSRSLSTRIKTRTGTEIATIIAHLRPPKRLVLGTLAA
jgi:hypothetical protein